MILACLAALFVGSHVVLLPLPILSIALAAVFVAVWSLTAGNLWWIPMLTGGTILGVFKIGVKITPVEVSFVLGILALAPLLMVRAEKALQPNRRALPLIFYLTGFYILVRLGIDVIPAQGARGNLGRVLFDAIWPFIFGFLFHHYGNLTAARFGIGVMFVALCGRCGAAIIGYLTSIPLYIPGINYVLSFSSDDSLIAMRSVALTLMTASGPRCSGADHYGCGHSRDHGSQPLLLIHDVFPAVVLLLLVAQLASPAAGGVSFRGLPRLHQPRS